MTFTIQHERLIGEGFNTFETNDEARNLNREEMTDVNRAGSSQSTPSLSKEVAR